MNQTGGDRLQKRIRNLREDHDYTQQQVADALGITQRKYSYLETGTQQWTDEFLYQFLIKSLKSFLLRTA